MTGQLGSIEFYWFTGESNRRCQRLLRQAIHEDPGFGAPYARLAYAMILEMVYFDGDRDRARMDEALELARRGVACDDQDAGTLFALGRVRLARCEYELAIDALEEALRLNPCLALCYCGLGDSLAYEDGSTRRSSASRPRSTSARTTPSAGHCRIFKRQVGVTPARYRQRLGCLTGLTA